jgi:hypothetical protein
MRAALFLLALAPLLRADDAALLRSSLATLQTGSPAARAEAGLGSPADRVAMKMSLTDPGTPWRARYLAAEWLLRAHLLRGQTDPVPAVSLERKDLLQAWRLISFAQEQSRQPLPTTHAPSLLYRGHDPIARMQAAEALSNQVGLGHISPALVTAMDTLALEIAVRLEDPALMAKALDPVQRSPQLQPRDKAFALMASAHAGRGDAARTWGLQLSGAPAFTGLHDRALRLGDSFDYTIFALPGFEPAVSSGPLPPSTPLAVKDYRIRLASAEGAAGDRIREAFGTAWHASGPAAPIQRLGALARWQAPGEGLPPLTGPATSDRIQLIGYLDLPKGRRIDTLDLKPDPARPGVWVGVLQSDRPAESGRTVLRFDAELELP